MNCHIWRWKKILAAVYILSPSKPLCTSSCRLLSSSGLSLSTLHIWTFFFYSITWYWDFQSAISSSQHLHPTPLLYVLDHSLRFFHPLWALPWDPQEMRFPCTLAFLHQQGKGKDPMSCGLFCITLPLQGEVSGINVPGQTPPLAAADGKAPAGCS